MKNYTITVNGNVYDVTVEEKGAGAVPAQGEQLHKGVQVVNSAAIENGYIALVIARPEALAELDVAVLDLPESLSGDVARPQ